MMSEWSPRAPDSVDENAAAAPFAESMQASHAWSGRRNPFPPIADYAFLSDCETTCLIAPSGRSSGCACPARTRRASSARSWTAAPALPDRPVRRGGAGRTALPARQPDAGDDLADPHRLADRARRAVMGPWHNIETARGRTAGRRPTSTPSTSCCAPSMRQRHRRPGDGLRAVVRLRPRPGALGVRGGRLRRGGRADRRTRTLSDAAADHQPADRHRGPQARARTRMSEGDNVFVALSFVRCPAPRPTTRPPTKMWRTSESGASGSPSATSRTTRGGRTCSAARSR